MRLLVTGGSGFIGRFLIPQLIDRSDTTRTEPAEATRTEPAETTRTEPAETTRTEPAETTRTEPAEVAVTLLLRETYNSHPLPPPLNQIRSHFNIVYADLSHINQTVRAIDEAAPDTVIHLAAAGATDPFLPVETAVHHNLNGTLNLLRACFENNRCVNQFIIARTPGELLGANPYAASKAAAWEFCRMYARTQAWPIYGAMIFQAYGPGQPEHTFIPAAFRAALSGEDFPMTAGAQTKDWIYAEDVAAGFLAMAGSGLPGGKPLPPGATIDIGTGSATSLLDVANLIYQTVNRFGRPLPGALPGRPGEGTAQIADAARTETLIGWQAKLSLADGLARLYQTVEL